MNTSTIALLLGFFYLLKRRYKLPDENTPVSTPGESQSEAPVNRVSTPETQNIQSDFNLISGAAIGREYISAITDLGNGRIAMWVSGGTGMEILQPMMSSYGYGLSNSGSSAWKVNQILGTTFESQDDVFAAFGSRGELQLWGRL